MSLEKRVRMLEDGAGDVWSKSEAARVLREMIASGEAPPAPRARRLAWTAGGALRYGLAHVGLEAKDPRECTVEELRDALRAGEEPSTRFDYLGLDPAVPDPETPPAWRPLLERVDELGREFAPALPDPDDFGPVDWSYA